MKSMQRTTPHLPIINKPEFIQIEQTPNGAYNQGIDMRHATNSKGQYGTYVRGSATPGIRGTVGYTNDLSEILSQ